MAGACGTDMTSINILSTTFSVDASGVPQKVINITWQAFLTQSGITKLLAPAGTGIPSSYAPGQKAYATVTEADCITWVTAIETARGAAAYPSYDPWAQMDAQLAAMFTTTTAPKSGTGRPWVQSYPLWVVPKAYAINDIVNYQSQQAYRCIQAHTSQLDWQPPLVPALLTVYVPASAGPQPWVQPTGSSDAYALGAVVTHLGNKWTSTIAANVYEPGVVGWTNNGPYP